MLAACAGGDSHLERSGEPVMHTHELHRSEGGGGIKI